MERIRTTEDFIKKAKEIHGDKYDYSKTIYVDAKTKVIITCKIHGDFLQNPHNHISNKSGCPKCCKNHNRYDTNSFIYAAKLVHGDKYDYSDVVYTNGTTKVKIRCPVHGIFEQAPAKHLSGRGCPICGKISKANKQSKTKDWFIQNASLVHSNKYDYSLSDYKNMYDKVKIICPKHGIFEQTPHHHLNGHGCPYCSSSLMEIEIAEFLLENGIEFVRQYKPKWLGRQSLDFYIPKYNAGIECQGEQHFRKVFYRAKWWTDEIAEKNLEKITKLDDKKQIKCTENGVKLFYYSNKETDYRYKIYNDKNILLKDIKNEMGKVLSST